ncbi:LATE EMBRYOGENESIS ABUNDANT (LEA) HYDROXYPROLINE-RICH GLYCOPROTEIN FAMILY PROTEIN-RELATED [Salix koriyanagi]|uniref:LATE EMBRYOGENESIS ABUNDANT (LEA) HYDROXYPROLINE-RICH GLYCOPROTEIN FAMILY PROTEIN-RELATED n=1 Tax=Salix koriyanagi TaxID=2511006 RepID=A0A9Q0ZT83_9ROSI|nr:LATE EMBRYOGENESIS ABUNDANT (LEA) HYDROXYPROLINE-RICH GLYCOPROTEIN FAMILY PROTEIN-RELATED [Salix koriyanagi]
MTSKGDCGNHQHRRRMFIRRLFGAIVTFLLIVLIVILIVWAILRPSKPKFILQDATVYAFNVSSPNSLTSNFQVTIVSRDPDDRVGIYYDKLDIYATYRNQQITLRTSIPPSYQGHRDTDIWSPFIYGNAVPVSPYNSAALSQDQGAGVVMLIIKIDGRVRFKVGTFISARYRLHAQCPAYIQFGGSRTNGVIVGENAIKYQLERRCHVSL